MSGADEVVFPLPKESPTEGTVFLPIDPADMLSAGPAEAEDDNSVLKVMIGKAVIEIPAGISEDNSKSVMRIACEIC